jgi:ubiquinone/menaquinone biosynthesis C-methylase UbiE
MERTLEPEVMDDPKEAVEYDAMDHSEANQAFVGRLLDLGARGEALDLGTGPGHIPVLLCERCPEVRVLGVDLSPYMLVFAERRAKLSPHRARLRFALGDVKELDLESGSFDAVFSNTILHHIPDPRDFLAEAARLLRPGGTLLIRDLYRPPTPERALELVALHAGAASPDARELFRASLHAALTPEELRQLADAAGLGRAGLTIDSDRHMSLQIPAG